MDQQKDISPLYLAIYDVVGLIPIGRVTSYGAIAKAIGSPRSARVVGYAMNYSHKYCPELPAHRVVNRVGLLSGKNHFQGDSMQTLLEAEGIKVLENQIVDFESVFWDPMTELAD